eukprot:c10015_g1_i2 orf=358-1386(-)
MAALSWRLCSPAFRSGRQSMLWKQQPVELAFSLESQCRAVRLITGSVKALGENVDEGKDIILKCISTTAEVSVLSISATHLVEEAQSRHKASPTALATLGRALMGTLLLGALKDNAESVQITFVGDGPIGKLITVASKEGWVKGFVENPLCEIPPKANNKLNVGAAVGSGTLNVSFFHPTWKQPSIGTVPIFSGEIAEDIAHYLASSEQVNTAIGLGVTLKKDGSVQSAHGFLVQVLPFCSEETLTKLEANIKKMRPLSDTSEEIYAQEILESILEGIGMGELYTYSNPKFGPCDVSELRQRMLRAVALLGPSDLQKLLDEQVWQKRNRSSCGVVTNMRENS